MKKILSLFLIFGIALNAVAGIEVNEFSNKQDENRFNTLVNELRCVVCQNQNLADSNAELAQDLRQRVYQMIQKGQSSEEIIDFMVARYGDFVLYKPPFNQQTFILWLGPFLILLFAVIFLFVFIKKNKISTQSVITEEEKNQAEKLIENLSDEKES